MEKEKANGLGHSSANLRNYYATHGDQSKICFHYIFHQFSDQVYCLTHIWEITIKRKLSTIIRFLNFIKHNLPEMLKK